MFQKELYKETITIGKKHVKLIASIKIIVRKLKLIIIKKNIKKNMSYKRVWECGCSCFSKCFSLRKVYQ